MLTVAIDPMEGWLTGLRRTEITGIAMLSRYLPWTKEDDERLKEFVAQGAPVIRAAAALRRTTIDVRIHAREVGCPFPSLQVERRADEVERAVCQNPEATARKLVEIASLKRTSEGQTKRPER